ESRRDEHDDRPGACLASQEIDLAQVRDHHVPGRVVFGGKENAISINVRLYQPHEREIRSPVREPERPSADEERGETADQLVTLARERGLHLRASTEAARHYEQVAAPEFPRNGRPWWSRLVRVRRGAGEGGIGAGELRLQRARPVTHEVVERRPHQTRQALPVRTIIDSRLLEVLEDFQRRRVSQVPNVDVADIV